MTLQQLNLKLSPAVVADWKRRAAAEGLSVRDWLVASLSPAAEPPAGPAGGAELLERLQALEQTTAQLAEALALRPAPRRPRPARATPAAPVPAPDDLPADAIQTAALADLLGLKRGALNNRISRAGGAREGLVILGWRCLGRTPAARGGPPQALWVPAES